MEGCKWDHQMESATLGEQRTQVCAEMCDGSHHTQLLRVACALWQVPKASVRQE